MSENIYRNKISSENFLSRWAIAGAIWLGLVAVLGIAMRLGFLGIPALALPFDHILHAHSHVAFFGWMGSMLFGLFYAYFVKSSERNFSSKKIILTFWLLQIFTFGAFCSFLAQGYARNSIFFSTLHIFLWYFFAWQIFPFLRTKEFSAPHLLAKTSLIFLLISTLGTWALPPIMVNGLGKTFLTRMAVDFFVHTFSDGWLITAALAVLFAKSKIIRLKNSSKEKFFRLNLALMIPAVMLTAPRSVIANFPPEAQNIIHAASILLGILHLHFLWLLRKNFSGMLFRAIGIFLLMKATMEISSAFPFAENFLSNRFVLIFYLHTKLLGIASLAVVAALPEYSQTKISFLTQRFSSGRIFLFGTALMIAALAVMCLSLVNAEIFSLSLINQGQWLAIISGGIIFLSSGKVIWERSASSVYNHNLQTEKNFSFGELAVEQAEA